MFEWSDLRYFLAVARHGSTLSASRALGVNQSTVQRRLGALERALGRDLVHRHQAGYRLTELGEALRPYAAQVEASVEAFDRQARASGDGLVGVIRLTCPEPIVARITASPLLDLFGERYPGLRVEFVMSDRYLDVARGDADVALRSGEPHDETLMGRKIADSIWAVYASASYVQRRGRPESIADLDRFEIIGFEGIMTGHRAAKWLAAVAPNATVAARNGSVLGVMLAVKSGVGVAPLPTTIADAEVGLVQVLPPVPELSRGWYLLTHPDLRRTPRIAAFFDFVVENLDVVRPILMG